MKSPFRGFTAILLKEFTIVFRDRTTLFFMFFPPLLQIIAFGFALDNDVKHMGMVVLNEDRSAESRQFIEKFVNTQTFRVVDEVRSLSEMSAAIRRGKAYIGLQIPPEFTRDREGFKRLFRMLIEAFPDLRFTTEFMIAEGDMVAAFTSVEGTHRGEFMGMPPSGKRYRIEEIHVFRLRHRERIRAHLDALDPALAGGAGGSLKNS
jgi:predicted ester cyclase